MVYSEENQALIRVRKESLCKLFKHVGVFVLEVQLDVNAPMMMGEAQVEYDGCGAVY